MVVEGRGITADGATIVVSGEGMKRRLWKNGDCIINIHVDMSDITPEVAQKVARVLSGN